YRDAILVVAGAFDIVGRVTRCTVMSGGLIEERKQPVKADGRAIEGSKIKRSHGISSFGERHAEGSAVGQTRVCCAAPREPAQPPMWPFFGRWKGVESCCFLKLLNFGEVNRPCRATHALSASAGLL